MQEQEKDIFQNYEIKNWNPSPRLYKIFGLAAIFNLMFLAVLAQTNVLTARGCDSPFVGRVCQVLDTIYIGGTLLGEKGDFVSKDYENIKLDDAEITYIDVSGAAPPLTYPEGYFALANPEDQFTAMQNPTGDFSMTNPIPGVPLNPTTSGTDLLATPQVTPTPNNNAVQGAIPTSPFSFGDNPIGANPVPMPSKPSTNRIKSPRRTPKVTNSSPNVLPNLGGETIAENKEKPAKTEENPAQPPLQSESVTDFKPNKKPLEDFADGILAKRAANNGNLDLTKPFMVQMTGELDKDGKLIAKKSGYVKSEGDEEMVNVAKAAIEAINNSGMFYYLKSQGVDKVDFTLVQDDKQIYAVITSSQKTEERAKTLSSGFNGLLLLAKNLVKEEELKTLIESSKVEPKGKNFVFNFAMPKPAVQEMINRKLQEAEAKKREAEKNNQTTNTAQSDSLSQKLAK